MVEMGLRCGLIALGEKEGREWRVRNYCDRKTVDVAADSKRKIVEKMAKTVYGNLNNRGVFCRPQPYIIYLRLFQRRGRVVRSGRNEVCGAPVLKKGHAHTSWNQVKEQPQRRHERNERRREE